jgi:hypothetical protein
MNSLLAALPPILADLPGEHIAARLALPIGIVVFCGGVYLLIWAVYGWKKGALIYGTAFFAFSAMIGVFWWFGAPGTPSATGLQNFPGQTADHYVGRWFPMEPGSERAEFFQSTNDLEQLQTPEAYAGVEDLDEEAREQDPGYRALLGDVATAVDRILEFYLPETEGGAPLIGSERRSAMVEAAGEAPEGMQPATPFFEARALPSEVDETRPLVRVGEEQGVRLIGVPLEVVAVYAGEDDEGAPIREEVVVEEAVWFAFQDPGALWFPSAVWTLVSLLLFALCLFGLDRLELREKRALAEREPVAS